MLPTLDDFGHALTSAEETALPSTCLRSRSRSLYPAVTLALMWATQFPDRQRDHYIFPFEKCGASGEEDRFGFTSAVVFYGTDATRPIGDWKEAWEKARNGTGDPQGRQ